MTSLKNDGNVLSKSNKQKNLFKIFFGYFKQCCGSVKFWYGSGFANPYEGLTDPAPAPDPALESKSCVFVSDLQDAKLIFLTVFLLLTSVTKPKLFLSAPTPAPRAANPNCGSGSSPETE